MGRGTASLEGCPFLCAFIVRLSRGVLLVVFTVMSGIVYLCCRAANQNTGDGKSREDDGET